MDTRLAMLEGVSSNRIIVGAYTDRSGGICPMLAAHRYGGRTNFLSFARAWDSFAATKRTRGATRRELSILTAHLEASLLAEENADLGAAIAEHRGLIARRGVLAAEGRRRQRRIRPGEPDRTQELRTRPGWAWLRPLRRYDDYERALALVEAEREEL
ncbi:MAG TPA: hypothetical protein VHE14_09125, partial [Solirubrobacteraceae bacterium]|nr:hypothetical protein [Solirubrobacteraceae bacterium]